MTDVFVSYAKEDRASAAAVAADLERQGFSVFWDRRIEAGAEWNEELQHHLQAAGCVCVLWSHAATASFWVRGEAVVAVERGVYVPFLLDDCRLPRLFAHVQATSLATWVRDGDQEGLRPVRTAVASRLASFEPHASLEPVADGEPVRERHLHLVHSCSLAPDSGQGGLPTYRMHVVLVGHPSALDRVTKVTYVLADRPAERSRLAGGPRERLFELEESATAFTIVRADVELRGQGKTIRLSHLVNMSERGPNLFADFLVHPSSRLREKLEGLSEACQRARELAPGRTRLEAMQQLIAEGYKQYAADAALDRAYPRP